MQIIGEGLSRWEYGKKSTSNSNTGYIYKDYEKYFDYKETLVGKGMLLQGCSYSDLNASVFLYSE